MKLMNCPACGLQISPQAKSCPGCGHPVANSFVSSTPDTRKRGGAVSSLVLGILSLFCFGILTGIPAIILGHKAHGRARKLPAQYAGGGVAIAGFILGYISIPLSLVFGLYLMLQKEEMDDSSRIARIINSENNLKQIGFAFRIWAGDHDDQYPFNVSQAQGGTRELCEQDSDGFEKNPAPTFMVLSNELSPRILVCPGDKTKKEAADFASLTAINISYQLRTGTNIDNYHPWEILAVDPINGLVLHCDGTVERDFHYKKSATNQ
jgi:hypothetical protein